MVCDGPEPPEYNPQDLTPPPMHRLIMEGPHAENEDSEEEVNDYGGYQPLPQGPDGHIELDHSDDENEHIEDQEEPPNTVPPIEPMDSVLTREVWSAPRPADPIQMDSERAQQTRSRPPRQSGEGGKGYDSPVGFGANFYSQVMSAMANFVLPAASIPQWAQCVSEDQWKQTLSDKIEKLNNNK